MAKSKSRAQSKWKKNWQPTVKYADAPWKTKAKHDEFIDVLLTGRFPLVELQDYLGVTPTKDEKKAAGKYGHVKGITYLIQNARLLGWPVQVSVIDGETWVWLPQHVIDEEGS